MEKNSRMERIGRLRTEKKRLETRLLEIEKKIEQIRRERPRSKESGANPSNRPARGGFPDQEFQSLFSEALLLAAEEFTRAEVFRLIENGFSEKPNQYTLRYKIKHALDEKVIGGELSAEKRGGRYWYRRRKG